MRATRVGGNAELVEEGVTGTLVPSDDADAMAAAICDYAFDPARCDAEGRAGRNRAVAHFSIDAMVSRYAELYDKLLESRLPSARKPAAAGTVASGVVGEAAGPARR